MSVLQRVSPRRLATIAAIAAVLDLAVLGLFHLVRPDVDPLLQPTSVYVHGAFGFFSPIATAAVGLGALALAGALKKARSGAVVLAIFGVAKVLQAFFPIDQQDTSTTGGVLHDVLGNIAFFAFPIAVGLLTRTLRERWTFASPAAVLVIVTTGLLLLGESIDLGMYGLLQRVYLAMCSLWMLAAAAALLEKDPTTAE